MGRTPALPRNLGRAIEIATLLAAALVLNAAVVDLARGAPAASVPSAAPALAQHV